MNEKPAETRQLDDASWWFRFRYTPVSDAIHGAITARLSVAYAVDAANLPAPLPQTIMAVVRRTKLWHRERLEVARELIAHFQDGLDSGSSAEELAQSFGDVKQAAALIRRAKKRNRPLWWRTGRRTVQGMVLLPVVLILLYLPIAARFFIGSPTITHDYVADLNKTALAVPLEQRAWPVYRKALVGLPKFDTLVDRPDPPHPAGIKPGDPDWPAFEQFVIEHADRIATIRRAASMPGFGFVPATRFAEEDYELWPETKGHENRSDGSVISVLLPYLSEMRRIASMLVLDIRRAAEVGDAPTVMDNFTALIGVTRHARENPILIGDMVSLAIFQMTLDRLGEIIETQPGLFTDDQWHQLAHRFAAVSDDDLRVRVAAERPVFYDIVQRMFTNDGNGNGRITFKGMRLMGSMVSLKDGILSEDGAMIAATPALSLLVLDRRDMLEEYDRLLGRMERNGDLPIWQRESSTVGNQLESWKASPVDRWRYFPMVWLMPAIDHATLQHEYVRGSRDAMLVAIALELHRRRHGAWPSSLAELVPSLLPSVPVDRFDGQPLRYRIIDGEPLLYSVGANRTDESGEPARELRAPWQMGQRPPVDYRPWSYANNSGDWVLWPPLDETEN